ncbi:MAG TPA: sigma-70 family RNA polymerase sigma factor [Solirubrobacteraceae bacterium]|nr:sigma-70 family RNA polymerase sigma factor [Solirubrobacteraceae bacterium]
MRTKVQARPPPVRGALATAGAAATRIKTATAEASDNDLMEAIQAGSREAFASMYNRYSERAYAIARAIAADEAGAERAVEEGFLAVWNSRGGFRSDRSAAGARLLRMVGGRAIESAGRGRSDSAGGVESPSGEPTGVRVRDSAVGHEVRRRVGELRDAELEVVVLAFYGRLTHTEIAAELGVPVGTVKGRLRDGMHALREGLVSTRSY